MSTAFIFPGQGAQFVGMAKDVAAAFPEAKDVFDRAAERLGFDIAVACFEGPEESLKATRTAQPGILTTSLAVLAAMRATGRLEAPSAAAGLSLGEYTALVVAGAMDPYDAVELVRLRGSLMEDCCAKNPGGMVSVLGLGEEDVRAICEEASSAGIVTSANLNCPGQVVVSGDLGALDKVRDLAKQKGAKRALPLKVEGAFHSPLMAEAGRGLAERLKDVKIVAPQIPVVSNVTGKPVAAPDEIRDALAQQVSSTVRWEACMRQLIADGFRRFVEIGPGKVLAGLARRIDPDVEVISVGDCEAIEAYGK